MAILRGKSLHWENVIFLQNFNEESLSLFPASWSLSVEEWFYLLIPFLILSLTLVFKKANKEKLLFTLGVLFILLEVVIRRYYSITNSSDWDYSIRKQIFLRLDSILFGVLLAGVKIYYGHFYNKFFSNKVTILISFVGVIWSGLYYRYMLNGNFFDDVFLLPLTSICFVAMVGWIEKSELINVTIPKQTIIKKMVEFISMTSYCVYLIHLDIFKVFNVLAVKLGSPLPSYLFAWASSLVFIFVAAYISFKYFETPVLKYRDKLTTKEKAIGKQVA